MDTSARRVDADWYRALYVRERVALWREHGSPSPLSGVDLESAEWRLQEWKDQPPFGDDGAFGRYLTTLGVAESELRDLLGVPGETLRDWCGRDPGWMRALERTLARQGVPLPWVEGSPGRQILEVFSPFLLDACDRLDAAAAELAVPSAAPGTASELFVAGLLTQIVAAASRVFTLELHVARLQGLLAGNTSAERFVSFVDRMRRPEALAELLKEYPLLARTLVGLADQWVESSAEILEHLAADDPALRETFHGGAALGGLVSVDATGVGDVHRGGRSVAILHFSSGLRLVHKPRSLAVDEAFHELLHWVGAGTGIEFRTPATLCRDGYGWVEFVHAAPCATEADVEMYYERLGGLLALLHVLDAQDMHMENVLAAGAHPVIVDLETLFHPLGEEMIPLAGDDYGEPASAEGGALEPPEILARSVLKVGLLPQRIWAEDDRPGMDLSAVGGVGDQVAPELGLHVQDGGSDEMRLIRAELRVAPSHNRPRLEGEAVTATAYAHALDRGFTRVHEALAARAAELSPGGKLGLFADIPLRVVVRMTRTYASLLRERSHPDLLRDGTDRDRYLDKLWLGTRDRPRLAEVIRFEQDALRAGDVPMFFAAPGSRDLVSDGGAVLGGFFHRSGIERVAERVASLNTADLERQRLLIRASMATLVPDPLTPTAASPPRLDLAGSRPETPPPAGPLREDLLRAALELGERLRATALRGPRKASWASLTTEDGRSWTAGFARYDLHGGLPGIILFLDRLGEVAETREFAPLARSAFLMLRDFLHDGEVALTTVGAFSGMGGILFALGGMGPTRDDRPVERLAKRVIARIAERVPEQRSCALFGGLAGALAGLLSYHSTTGTEAALETAVAAGHRLLSLAERVDGRLDWPSAHPIPPHATGFACGTAGIAWALLHLVEAVGDERFRAPALEALEGAWLRYAEHGRAPATAATWCHGAPGMVLALLAARRAGASGLTAALADAIAETSRGARDQGTHALCNGVLGSLDVLEQAGDLLDLEVNRRVESRLRAVLHEAARTGWRCGAPLGVEPPGLMNGIAGIGYALLRAADPDNVPSVLTLGLTHTAARPPAPAPLI